MKDPLGGWMTRYNPKRSAGRVILDVLVQTAIALLVFACVGVIGVMIVNCFFRGICS